jgi:hypothetical protein
MNDEHPKHCENACKFFRGWFVKVGYEVAKLHKDDTKTTSSFILCARYSETHPLRIYHNASHMMTILGCGSFENGVPAQKEPLKSPVQDNPDVKECGIWTRINNREAPQSRQNVQQSVQIDGYKDLSVTNVDELPTSLSVTAPVKKKRISNVSIFQAQEFNAGDPFAQMKSDEVDEFCGEDDAP